jgi:hypothetical protein
MTHPNQPSSFGGGGGGGGPHDLDYSLTPAATCFCLVFLAILMYYKMLVDACSCCLFFLFSSLLSVRKLFSVH